MEGNEHDAHDEDNVNHSTGNVKCEEPKQPKNNQNGSDEAKHDVIPLLLSAGRPALPGLWMFS